ncbi:MAG: hypothetical protein LC114_17885 [Bryobacterales bacterium]|nr:hypothetical protein [Bryobacterales bacterium]
MADPTAITVQTIKGPFEAVTAGSVDFTFAAGTVTDGDTFVCTGRELLLVTNTEVADAKTITITSVDDEKGRSEDITTYSLAAGDFAVFGVGLTNAKGWKSTAGTIRITVSAATVKVAVLRLPAGYP